MPEVGKKAPDFTLLDQNGAKVKLSSFRGQPVVLYFYPQDSTPTCTNQACAFRDANAEYEAAGAKVIGVSPDNVASHAKFVTKQKLNFTLVADTERKVCEAYDVWHEKTMFGRKYMGVVRTTFVIDAKGVVRKVFSKVRVAGHIDAVLAAVKELA